MLMSPEGLSNWELRSAQLANWVSSALNVDSPKVKTDLLRSTAYRFTLHRPELIPLLCWENYPESLRARHLEIFS